VTFQLAIAADAELRRRQRSARQARPRPGSGARRDLVQNPVPADPQPPQVRWSVRLL